MPDTICKVCDRVHFEGNATVNCEKCKWPLPGRRAAIFEQEKPYGHDLIVEVLNGMSGRKRIEKHYKGCESTCRRRATMNRGFLNVIAVRPLTEAQYIAAYGEGRM